MRLDEEELYQGKLGTYLSHEAYLSHKGYTLMFASYCSASSSFTLLGV